jgi:hypothetical protein
VEREAAGLGSGEGAARRGPAEGDEEGRMRKAEGVELARYRFGDRDADGIAPCEVVIEGEVIFRGAVLERQPWEWKRKGAKE